MKFILPSLVIIIFTIFMAIKSVKKENGLCNYNCHNCNEKEVCDIRGKHKNE